MKDFTKLSDEELFAIANQNSQNQDFSSMSDEELMQIASNNQPQQYPQNISRSKALLTTISNIPFAPRIKAKIASKYAKLVGGLEESEKDLYNEALKNELANLQQAREQYPVQSIASEIAANIPLPGKGLKTAMAYGAGQSIGETEDLRNLEDVAKKGAGGALGTAIGYGLIKGISKTVPTVSKTIVKTPQGVKNIYQRLTQQTKPEDILGKVIESENIPKYTSRLEKNITQGRDVSLPEVARDDENVLGLTRLLAKTRGSNNIIDSYLKNKTAYSAERVNKLIDKISPKNYFNTLDENIAKRKELASPLFQKGYEEGKKIKLLKKIPAPKKNISEKDLQERENLFKETKENLFKEATGDSGIDNESELFSLRESYKNALKEIKENKPTSLLQFIRENGGITDYKGELKSLGMTNKTLPGLLRKEGTKGIDIDSIGEKLQEAGYSNERLTVNEILNLIDEELRGNKIYLNFNPDFDSATQFINEVDQLGLNMDAIKKLENLNKKIKKELPVKFTENILNSLNPTGTVVTDYSPELRMTATLGKNITTLDKTSGKSPDELITIYRGAPKDQKEIVGGDFITTNLQLAQDYAGDGHILSKKVKLKDILDDVTDPIGEKYIYRPFEQSKINENNKLIIDPNDKFRNLLTDKRIRSAILLARKNYGLKSRINSVETLHGARQVIDDIIETAKRTGENNKARSYLELKSKMNDIIYDVAPTMKQADKVYSGFSALKTAQENGLKFNRFRNGEEVKRFINKLNEGEKETFKIGVKDYLMDKAMKTGDDNSSAKKIFSQPLEREKIKAVFNNSKEFNDFAKKMFNEINLVNVKNRVLGGSRTDINLAQEGQFLDKIAKGSIYIKTFGLNNILMATTDAIRKRYYGLNEQTAKNLAQVIIDPNKSLIALQNIQKKALPQEKPLINKFIQDLSQRMPQKLQQKTKKSSSIAFGNQMFYQPQQQEQNE